MDQVELPSIGDGSENDDSGGIDSDSSQSLGVFDPQCQASNVYDACIFWKNPLAKQKSPLPTLLQFGDDLSARQTFGVRLENLIDPTRLESTSIRVYVPGAVNSTWKIPYALEAEQHTSARVMTYFWLTAMEKRLFSRTGIYWAKGKNIPVNAYNSRVDNNAYWSNGEIVIGNAAVNATFPSHELALSAEVTLHEMGHANLSMSGANPGFDSCRDQTGCMGAINEGQADFHYVMMFPESTTLAETAVNNMLGWNTFGLSRDVKAHANTKAIEFFEKSGGELHGMGSAYASILWEIYSHPQVNKIEFEKIFLLHLQKFSSSASFLTARDLLFAEDQAHFSGKYHQIIFDAFAQKGL